MVLVGRPVGGRAGGNAGSRSSDDDPRALYVGRLDADGNELWTDSWTAGVQTYPNALAISDSDEILVAGSAYEEQPWLRRYAPDGSLLSSTRLLTTEYTVSALALAADGLPILGGYMYLSGSPIRAWLGQLDSSNAPMWMFEDSLDP